MKQIYNNFFFFNYEEEAFVCVFIERGFERKTSEGEKEASAFSYGFVWKIFVNLLWYILK